MTVRQVHRPKVILWPDGQASSRLDVSRQCVHFRCQKAITSPEGRWSIDLAPVTGQRGPSLITRIPDAMRSLRPNGLVSIGYDRPGGIMLGLIDDVSQERSLLGDNAGYVLRVSGSDMGKALARDHIIRTMLTTEEQPKFFKTVSDALGNENPLLQAFGLLGPEHPDGTPVFQGSSVADVVRWILDHAPSMRVPLLKSIGGVGKVGEFVLTGSSVTTWNDGRVWSDRPRTFSGTMWDFLRGLLDEDFYEMWLDSSPTPWDIPDVELIIRPKPFDEPGLNFLPVPALEGTGLTWPELKTRIKGRTEHDIPQGEIFAENLGYTDADVYGYYLVNSENDLAGNRDALKEGLFYPAIDLAAVARSGMRAYEGQLSLLAADIVSKQQGQLDFDNEVAGEVVTFRNRLFNWYRCNEVFQAGSLQVAGKDEYKAGDPVMLRHVQPPRSLTIGSFIPRGARFYCPSVVHEWSSTSPYTTTMSLMRGHNTSVITQFKREVLAASHPSNPNGVALVSR